MARAQNLLGFCFFACASQTPFSCVWPGGLQAFSLFLVGSKSNVSAVFWLRFRMVWALFLSFSWVPKATFRHFSGCGFAMACAQNLLGLCLFGCAPDAAFLGFAWWLKFRFAWWLKFRSGWGTIPLFLGVPKATFRDFWGCSSAMAWTENLLGLCLFGRAPDAAFLGFAWWLKFRSGWGTISLFLGVPNATFRDFWGCSSAMAWTQNLLGLCLFGCAPDAAFLGFAWWLKFRSCWAAFLAFASLLKFRSGWGTIPLFLGVPKATFRDFWGCSSAMAWTENLLGLCLYRMPSRRSFLRLCLLAEVSQWLGHDFIVFRGSKRNVSRFLRLQFRNGLDAKPAGALPFRMRSRRIFLRHCPVAEVSPTQLSYVALKFSTGF